MNILVSRTDALGDTLLTLPMVWALRKARPQSKIILLVGVRNQELLQGLPYVDEVLALPYQSRITGLKKIFSDHQIDHYLYVGGSWLPSLVALFKGVKFRGGLVHKWHGLLFLNQGARQKRSRPPRLEWLWNLELLDTLKIDYPKHDKDYPELLSFSPEEKDQGEQLKKSLSRQNAPTVVIHPGRKGHTLNWPAPFYAQLANLLGQKFNVVLSYTTQDQSYIQEIKTLINSQVVHLLNGEKVGLRGYLSLLKSCDFFIGPSTGTTHLANLLGLPLVAFYSPLKKQTADRWGPFYSHNSKVLTPSVGDEEFKFYDPSNGIGETWMARLSVEQVRGIVDQYFKEKGNL